MSAGAFAGKGGALRAAVLGAAMLLTAGANAKSTGVGNDPAIPSGSCYEALVDKNAATPTTAPNRELGAACEAEHGDVNMAWARVIRLWGADSTDVPDYDSYRAADAPMDGMAAKWLAIAGLLLAYAVLGTPMRSAARLTGAYPGPAKGAALDVAVCLMLRGLIVAAFVALFSIPYLAAIGGVALIGWIAFGASRAASSPAIAPADVGSARALSVHLAEAINDAAGASSGLAALALLIQHDFALFAAALALALIASIGPVILARRALRATRFGATAASALLVAVISELLILAPPFSTWGGGLKGAGIAAPLALALLTLLAGWRAGPAPARPAQS